MSGCNYFDFAKHLVMKHFEFDEGMIQASFDSRGDVCFCRYCFEKRGDKSVYTRGSPPRPYITPVGWARIGLKFNAGLGAANNPLENWNTSFHGTSFESMHSIFNSGLTLLKPGDVKLGGEMLGIGAGHIKSPSRRTNLYSGNEELFDPNQIFTSPSIVYSSLHQYAQPQRVTCDEEYEVQIAFQLRQRPGSFQIGQETVGANRMGRKIDQHISNNELEYYTKEGVGIIFQGLLIKVIAREESDESMGRRRRLPSRVPLLPTFHDSSLACPVSAHFPPSMAFSRFPFRGPPTTITGTRFAPGPTLSSYAIAEPTVHRATALPFPPELAVRNAVRKLVMWTNEWHGGRVLSSLPFNSADSASFACKHPSECAVIRNYYEKPIMRRMCEDHHDLLRMSGEAGSTEITTIEM